jgi:hypothetical protein
MPFGVTAPGLVVPKFVVPMKGFTRSAGFWALMPNITDNAMMNA